MGEASDEISTAESWARAAAAGPFPEEALIRDNRPMKPPVWRYGMPVRPAARHSRASRS